MPAIKMRGGRVNFKFGDTKSVFYFSDADFDVAPSTGRFGGTAFLRRALAHGSRARRISGIFFVRGDVDRAQRLDMRVELETQRLEEVARLIDRRDFGLHGDHRARRAALGLAFASGVTGELQIDDVHRWDLLPQSGGGWRIAYKGTLDLHGEAGTRKCV